MSLAYLAKAVARAAAIKCFGWVAAVPAWVRMLPEGRVRRLVSGAALPGLHYSGIFSQAVYAPWRADADFAHIFGAIKRHTLVDEYRCFELWTLAAQLAALPPGNVLEVGVWRGGTGCLLASRCQMDLHQSKVYLCDTFKGVVHATSQDSTYVGGEHADTATGVVQKLAGDLGLTNIAILEGIFPEDTARLIEHERFRLCHIDVDVYESAQRVFDWVWPRIVPGGVVVFDDYGFYSCSGVTRLVNQIFGRADCLVVYNINGHAIAVKRTG